MQTYNHKDRESEKEGGVGVNEGGKHNCCYPWRIHTTNEGGTDFTQRGQKEGVKSQREMERWDGRRADDP